MISKMSSFKHLYNENCFFINLIETKNDVVYMPDGQHSPHPE